MTERLALSIAVIAAKPTATSILLCYLQSSQIGSDRKRATFFWRRMAGFTGICRRLIFIATSTNYFDVLSARRFRLLRNIGPGRHAGKSSKTDPQPPFKRTDPEGATS